MEIEIMGRERETQVLFFFLRLLPLTSYFLFASVEGVCLGG